MKKSKKFDQAREERIAKAKEEIRAAVALGVCPTCGAKLKRNASMTGWWQCEQFGSEQFRVRPQDPPCSWQGFL